MFILDKVIVLHTRSMNKQAFANAKAVGQNTSRWNSLKTFGLM